MKKKIIINADDCGKDFIVDKCIRDSILQGRISSTTIMANMDDFEGAVSLYNDFNDIISFGWHINLTEGSPLTHSQQLLDIGFYKEIDGKLVFNGQQFRNKIFDRSVKNEIKKELRVQWEKLHDNGIEISHADSHHHIHAAPSMLWIRVSLFEEMNITRCRHIKNYGFSKASNLVRFIWTVPFKLHGIRMPDNLGDFAMYYNNPEMPQGKVIELECHPGHSSQFFQDEMKLVYDTDIKRWDAQLITYKDF